MRRGNLLLLGAGLLIGLGVAEMIVRVLDLPPRPLDPLHVGSYQLSDDPVLRYVYKPGLSANHAAYDPMHRGLSTNAQGFRDREFSAIRPPGGLRVLALGDSTTAALGVPDLEDAWPKRLEQRLRETRRRSVEVWNLGVGGYDPLQEAELLRVRGVAFDPDLVLMLVSLNDLDSGVDGGVYEKLLEARRHLDVPRRDLSGLLMQQSRLLFVAVHRLSAIPDVEGRRSRARETASSPLEEGLTLLRRVQEEHGFEAVVFLLPGLDSAYARYAHRPLHRRMAEIAKRVGGIEWVDLLEGMAEANANLRLLSFDGLHPNRVGQAVVAELIFQELRKRRLP